MLYAGTLGPELQLAEKLMTPLAEDLAQSRTGGLEEIERDYIVRILEERHWKIEGIDGAAQTLKSTQAPFAAVYENSEFESHSHLSKNCFLSQGSQRLRDLDLSP